MLLSRELSLFFKLDLSKIPASKRPQALQQQLLLLSPFANPGHYANWQAGRAQVWIWDQAALLERLPQAARYSVLPDSALSLNSPLPDGERLVAGIRGLEWQRWRDGQLDDSRWATHHTTDLPPHELDLSQRSPLQAADRQLLQNVGMASIATALLAALLIQIGAWLDLSHSQERLTSQLAERIQKLSDIAGALHAECNQKAADHEEYVQPQIAGVHVAQIARRDIEAIGTGGGQGEAVAVHHQQRGGEAKQREIVQMILPACFE